MKLLSWFTFASTFAIGLADDTQTVFDLDDLLFSAQSVLNATAAITSSCCTRLNSALPSQTHFMGDDAYEAQQLRYYSVEQREIRPACRVTPASADDMSLIVQIAKEEQCPFAVKSGGNQNWGGSNVGPSGFTIDLGNLTAISVQEDKGIVSIDSGCIWRQVYQALAPYNLSTVGGRASNVGVGGFLMGGGISFLSIEHGLGSDNIVNYLVVLADGTIANVNATSKPDLFWALKYGSTNFGIVVRFDMLTYRLGEMWGGSLHFPFSKARSLLEFIADMPPKLADDPKGMSAVMIGWNPAAQDYFVWTIVGYRAPTVFPPLFAPLATLEPVATTLRVTSLVSLTDELVSVGPQGVRAQWISLTFTPDVQTMMDIVDKGKDIFEPHLGRTGFTWVATFQPLNAGLAAAASRHGGNPSGLSPESGDLVLYAATITWQDAADDVAVKATVQEYLAWAKDMTARRGVLNRFVYLNYALGTQDVMGGVGSWNLDELKRIQAIYDPQNTFGKYWEGGFKL
ncbi:hypothetical protein DFH09DRAFT_1153128 [Mycena vulgaris]|nr:hypothetical protein DFH09DRAFT_1167599 [Mycena vulgaris]KAJ6572559.1 hypothetical protein DFH09DRAFT_1153128 [Mycena vulgaris]